MSMNKRLVVVLIMILLALTCLSVVLANPRVTDASGPNDDNVWEVGALYIEKYNADYCTCSRGSGLPDLYCPRIYAERLISVMSSKGFRLSFQQGNANVYRDLFVDKSLGGTDLIDTVDLFYFVGHGNPGGLPMCVGSKGICPVHYDEMRLGDEDLEWAIFDSCRSLRTLYEDVYVFNATSPSVWRQVFRGLHAIAGYATDIYEKRKGICIFDWCLYVTCDTSYNRAEEFAKLFTSGKSFAEAWYWATRTKVGRSDAIACVFSPWDPATRDLGMFDAPFANPPIMTRDTSVIYAWGSWCWNTG